MSGAGFVSQEDLWFLIFSTGSTTKFTDETKLTAILEIKTETILMIVVWNLCGLRIARRYPKYVSDCQKKI